MTTRSKYCFAIAAIAGVSLLSAGTANAAKSNRLPQTQVINESIIAILNAPQRLPFHLQRYRKALKAHYVQANSSAYWLTSPARVSQFVQRMMLADDDGLKPNDYPADYLLNLRGSLTSNDPVAAAFTELTFSSFFIKYATDLKTGRFVPSKIDPKLFQPKRGINRVRLLSTMGKAKNPGAVLNRYQPANRHYRALKPLLQKYRRIVDNGGWKPIDFGTTLKPGMSDPRIPAIRRRLELSGDLKRGSGSGDTYDTALAKAVKGFQRRRGLNDEGIVGKLTLVQMNIKARERLRQIVVNMERWRWMPEHMGVNHIMVNIAAFRLYRTAKNKVVEVKNVVVGKKFHQTPVFSDKMEYVVLNPTWTVPRSIATKEMLPKLQKNPAYLKADFEVLRGGKPVPSYSIDWNQYTNRTFPFVFRQRPGPRNALGVVKFIMPNKHAIYLHDTPSKSLFSQKKRAFSHGCVRVHQPIKFADSILALVPGWSPARIRQVLQSKKLTQINLPKHLPVHIVYATVWAGKNGKVNFRPDIYDRDRRLYRALFAKPTS